MELTIQIVGKIIMHHLLIAPTKVAWAREKYTLKGASVETCGMDRSLETEVSHLSKLVRETFRRTGLEEEVDV